MLNPKRQIDAACPECGTTLQESEDGADVYCPLPGCEWHNEAPGVPDNEYNTDAVRHLAEKHGYDEDEVEVLLKWRAGEISEGEAADKLAIDRLEARTMLEPLTRRAPRKVREEHSESTETKTE